MIARLLCTVSCAAYVAFAAYAASGDEVYALAIEQYEIGHYAKALDGFRDAGLGGHVRAQEIAAFMILAGPTLYGASMAVDRVAGLAFLSRAAEAGSDMARYILCTQKFSGRDQRRINCPVVDAPGILHLSKKPELD